MKSSPSSQRTAFVISIILFPGGPDFGAVTCSSLLAVADDGGFHEGGIVKNLILLGSFVIHVFHQGDIRVFAVPVNEVVDAAHGPQHTVKFLAGHTVFLQIDGLVFDPALLEPALCFFRIEALAFSKNLNVQ